MGLVVNKSDLQGLVRVLYGTFTFSNSYTTNGEAADPGVGEILKVDIDQGVNGRMFQYDYSAKKIKAYNFPDAAGVAAEVSNGTNLSTTSVKMKFTLG